MTPLAIIVPTLGRRSLQACLESLAPQVAPGDRVVVVCDNPGRYDFCREAVDFAREQSQPEVIWRCLPNTGRRGFYGHSARNCALRYLDELVVRPEWVWSLDDDDIATFGALDIIRDAAANVSGKWLMLKMRGGAGSHFAGTTVPTMGPTIHRGNVGTPMIVFPLCEARYGVAQFDGHAAGYFGDYEMAVALQSELGEPTWVDAVVCEVRPTNES